MQIDELMTETVSLITKNMAKRNKLEWKMIWKRNDDDGELKGVLKVENFELIFDYTG